MALKTIKAVQWAGLSLCRALRKVDLQSTDRLTQEKCQAITILFYTGDRIPSFFLLSRSVNEWLVGEEGNEVGLKENVGEDPLIPPTTGWKFYNKDMKAFEEDAHLTYIGPTASESASCSITVSLSGRAKDIQRDCE